MAFLERNPQTVQVLEQANGQRCHPDFCQNARNGVVLKPKSENTTRRYNDGIPKLTAHRLATDFGTTFTLNLTILKLRE
jgi:hypothetical protein